MDSCPICLGKIQESNVSITVCKHKFCTSCLLTSVKTNNTCPICRHVLTDPFYEKKSLSPNLQMIISNDVNSRLQFEVEEWMLELNIPFNEENKILFLNIIEDIIDITLEETESYLNNNQIEQNIRAQSILTEDLVDIIN